MPKIRYTQTNAQGSMVVSYGSGQTFAIDQALRNGNGSFTVDDQALPALITALDASPVVQRSGGEGAVLAPNAVVATQIAGPTGPAGPSGNVRVGYSQITSANAITGNARGDGSVPLQLLAVPIGARPVDLIFGADALQQTVDQGVCVLWFMSSPTGANTWTDLGLLQFSASGVNGRVPGNKRIPLNLAAGTYDFKTQLQAGAAGQTVSIIAGPGGNGQNGPAFLEAVMV